MVTAFSGRESLFERAISQLEAIIFVFWVFFFFWKKYPLGLQPYNHVKFEGMFEFSTYT